MSDPENAPNGWMHSACDCEPSRPGIFVVIVANRPLANHPAYQAVINRADLLICADGGARSALARGWTPDVVVGDMDSVDAATLAHLRANGCELLQYARAKDETDLELALLEAERRGASRITMLGVMGGRADHTLANLLLMALPAVSAIPVRILDGETEILLIRDRAEIQGQIGDTVSLIPIAGDAVGITTSGLKWALHDDVLRFGLARGVSNVMTAPLATIRLREGLLVAVHLPSEPPLPSTLVERC